MARGRGKPFPKGVSGNPKGRPPIPEDVAEARKLTRIDAERILNKYSNMSLAELLEAKKDTSLPVIEHFVLSVLTAGVINGDEKRLGFLLDRLIGKVKEPEQTHLHINLGSMPRTQVIELGKEAVAFLEAATKEDE